MNFIQIQAFVEHPQRNNKPRFTARQFQNHVAEINKAATRSTVTLSKLFTTQRVGRLKHLTSVPATKDLLKLLTFNANGKG